MSCVIRIEGKEFDVDKVLPRLATESPALPYMVVRKGEAYRKGRQALVADQSSLNFDVSSEFFSHLADELPVIRRFLLRHMATLSWLTNVTGVEYAYIDVVMQLRDVAQFPQDEEALPESVIQLLAMSGLRLRISFSSGEA